MVRSKAAVTTAELGDDYIMMGPYHEPTVKLEVEVCEPDHPIIREAMDQMRSNGIKPHPDLYNLLTRMIGEQCSLENSESHVHVNAVKTLLNSMHIFSFSV